MLRYVLDAHPEISCPPELHTGALCGRLAWSYSLALGHRLASEGKPSDGDAPPAPVLAQVSRTVHEMMAMCLERTGKARWCDKSVTSVDHLELLHGVFPDGRFIMLYRNCMDVVQSALDVSRFGYSGYGFLSYIVRSPENTVAGLIDYWCDKAERALAFEALHPEATFRVRYEDLVHDPAGTVPGLLDFVGVARADELIGRVFSTPHEDGPGDANIAFTKEISQTSVGKGSAVPLQQIPDRQRERMNELLCRLEYPLVGDDWDRRPSPYARAGRPAPRAGGDASDVSAEDAAAMAARLLASGREKGSVKFVFEDRGDEAWRVAIGEVPVQAVRSDAEADCEVRLSVATLVAITCGGAQPMELWRSGQLRLSGNADLVRRAFAA